MADANVTFTAWILRQDKLHAARLDDESSVAKVRRSWTQISKGISLIRKVKIKRKIKSVMFINNFMT